MDLDTLIYDPKRLVCSAEEKETCLETVRKLVRLSQYIRREGILSASLRETSLIPEFDRFLQLDLPQRQALLQETDNVIVRI